MNGFVASFCHIEHFCRMSICAWESLGEVRVEHTTSRSKKRNPMKVQLKLLRSVVAFGLRFLACLAAMVVSSCQCISVLGPKDATIPDKEIDGVAALQDKPVWCWAACIQMAFQYNHINVSQEQIVAATYGLDPDGTPASMGGSQETITANLRRLSVDGNGRRFCVVSDVYRGAPDNATLI